MRKAWFLLLPLLALSSCVPEGTTGDSSSTKEGPSSSSSEEIEGGFWIEGPSLLDIGERGRYELMGDVPEGEIHWEVEGESLVEPYEYPNPLYYGLTGLYEGEVVLKAMLGDKVLFPFEVEVKDADSGFLVDAGTGKLALGGKMELSFSLDGEPLPEKELSSVSITTLSSPSGKGLVSSYEDEGLYLLGEELGSFRAVASYEGLLSNPFEIEVIPSVEGKTYRLEALLEDGTPAEESTIPTSSTVTFVLRDEEGEDYPFQWSVELLEGDSWVLQETEDPHVFETYIWSEERLVVAPAFPGEAPALVEESLELYVMHEGDTPLLDFHLEDEDGNGVETLFVSPDGSTRFHIVPERETDYLGTMNVHCEDERLNHGQEWGEEGGRYLTFAPEEGGSYSLLVRFTFVKKEFPIHVMPEDAALELEIMGTGTMDGEKYYVGHTGSITGGFPWEGPIYCDLVDYDVEYVFLEGEDLVRIGEGRDIHFLSPGTVSLYARIRDTKVTSNTFAFEIEPEE